MTRYLAWGCVAGLALMGPLPLHAQDEHDRPHAQDEAEGDPSVRHLARATHHGGFPEFVDVFFTHHAYLERKIHSSLVTTLADAGREYEAGLEVAWQFASRFGGEIELPYRVTDPDDGEGASGVGDFEIAPMIALVSVPARRLIVTARSGFSIPTGDVEEGLGADGWTWEPGLLLWKGLGPHNRGAVQGELTYERLFADEGEDEKELVWNVAASWWLPSNWIPIVELNGVSPLGDEVVEEHHEEAAHGTLVPAGRRLIPAHGETEGGDDTLVAATVGFRYGFANGQQWGAGLQLPVNGSDAFDARIVVGGIIHLN